MRLVSWPGAAALCVAAVAGFVVGSAVHRHDPVTIQVCDAAGELSDAPPFQLRPPVPIEEIDLTCPPAAMTASGLQSPEPPLADPLGGVIIPTSYELPAGRPVDSELLPMPYLTDDPSPLLLPPLGDVPLLPPAASVPADLNNPLFQVVRRFVDSAAKLPDSSTDVTDKVSLGKPPVCEHPSSTPAKVGYPPKSANPTEERVPQRLAPLPSGDAPPGSKADTMEVRPGDLPPKSERGPF